MASTDPFGDRKMALLEQQYQESVREFDQHQQLLREQLAQQLAQDKGLKEEELKNALTIAGQGNVVDFNKMLAGLKGPADPYAYLFMSHGMATPRGYAAAPMALPDSVKAALGGPEAIAKMQQSLTGANSGNMFAYGQSHDYHVDDHGNLIHSYTDPNTNQTATEKLASGLTPGQDVQSYFDPGTNQTQLSVQTASGEQQNLRYNPNQGWNSQIIPKTGNAATGQPGAAAHMDAYGQSHNYWVDQNGVLQHTWQDANTGRQNQEQLRTGLMPGQNVGVTYNQQTGQTSLQYQGPAGKWGEMNYAPGQGWGRETWGNVGPTGSLANTPSPYNQNLPNPTWGGNGGEAPTGTQNTGVILPPGVNSPTGPRRGASTNPNVVSPPSSKTDTGGVTMGGVNGAPTYAGMLGGLPSSLMGNTQVQSPLLGSAAQSAPSIPIGTGAGAPIGGDSSGPNVPTPGVSTQPPAQPAAGPNNNAASPLLANNNPQAQGGIGSGLPNPNDPNAPKKVPTFDQGGTLAPGLNLINNATGGPEPLVNPNNLGMTTSPNGIHSWMSQFHNLMAQHPGMADQQLAPQKPPTPVGQQLTQVRPPPGQSPGPDYNPGSPPIRPMPPVRMPPAPPPVQNQPWHPWEHPQPPPGFPQPPVMNPNLPSGGPIRTPINPGIGTGSSPNWHQFPVQQNSPLTNTGGHLGLSTGQAMNNALGSTYASTPIRSGLAPGMGVQGAPPIDKSGLTGPGRTTGNINIGPLGAAATPSTTVGTGAGAPLGTDSTPQPSATAAAGASQPTGSMNTSQSPLLTGGNADQTKYGKPPLGLDKVSPAVRGLVNKAGTPLIPSMQQIKDMPQSDYDSYKNYIDQVAGGNSQDMEDMAKQLAPKGAPMGKFGGSGGSGV